MGNRWIHVCVSIVICLGWQAHIIDHAQAGTPEHAMDWNPLPNGLMSIAYDRTGDGIADYFTLHPITWSGWSAQNIEEIERQACMDEQWVFLVEYDHNRYVYLALPTPILIGDDPRQTGMWTAQKVSPSDVRISRHINTTGNKPDHETCLLGTPR
jgi:hypothetical protein